jgi:hypothetical protein
LPEVIKETQKYYLGQNVPNPITASSRISWTMPEQGWVSLKVYDILGNEMMTLANDAFNEGSHTITMSAADLKPGTYSYRIEISGNTSNFRESRRFVRIK